MRLQINFNRDKKHYVMQALIQINNQGFDQPCVDNLIDLGKYIRDDLGFTKRTRIFDTFIFTK